MRKLKKTTKEEIINCISMLQYGDKIECDGTYLSVYNSMGCLIDTIHLDK